MYIQQVWDTILNVNAWFGTVLFVAAILFSVHEKRRKYFWWRIIPSSIAFVLMPYLISDFYVTSNLAIDWFSFSYIILVILLIGLVYLCFDTPILNAVFYVTAAYAIQNSAYHMVNLIRRSVSLGGGSMTVIVYRIVGLVVNACMLAAYYFLLVRRIQATFTGKLRMRIFIASVLTVAIVYAMDMWIRHMRFSNLGVDIYAILINALLLVSQAGMFRESAFEREQALLREMLHQEGKLYKLNAQTVDIMNIKFHDLKHRIESYKNSDDLAEIKESLDIYNAFTNSGNRILDIILTEKSLECKSKNIKLGVIADGAALSFMKDSDVSALFGNILTNAIEAAEKAEADERIISMNVTTSKGFLVIHEDNKCVETLVFEDGLPKSSKKSPYFHGYGTKSIRYIAEKYGGSLKLHSEDGIFGLEVLIPIPAVE